MRNWGRLLEWDLLFSLLGAGASYILLPNWIATEFAKDIYGLGTSIVAVIFSVYIAALAIIMSSKDDEFVKFLSEGGGFEKVMLGFKFTLWLLFVALIYSIAMYGFSSASLASKYDLQHKMVLITFCFLLFWSIGATLTSSLAAIQHSELRVKFTRLRSGDTDD